MKKNINFFGDTQLIPEIFSCSPSQGGHSSGSAVEQQPWSYRDTVFCLMTLVRLLALDSLSRGLEYEISSWKTVKTNGSCDVKIWRRWQIDVLVWTQLPGSWWSLLSPYSLSLAHIGPCWLRTTCVTPVGLSTLDVRAILHLHTSAWFCYSS